MVYTTYKNAEIGDGLLLFSQHNIPIFLVSPHKK